MPAGLKTPLRHRDLPQTYFDLRELFRASGRMNTHRPRPFSRSSSELSKASGRMNTLGVK